MNRTKQVIVMRTDLGMRKGKMIAQGAHASLMFLTRKLAMSVEPDRRGMYGISSFLTPAQKAWLEESFKKICVRVDSEEALLGIYQRALDAGLTAHICVDSGTTEFHGVPTKTCVAIGPNWSDDIDQITGELELL